MQTPDFDNGRVRNTREHVCAVPAAGGAGPSGADGGAAGSHAGRSALAHGAHAGEERQEEADRLLEDAGVSRRAESARRPRVEAQLPPAAVPRRLSEGVHAHFLEAGDAGHVRAAALRHSPAQQLGAPAAGDPDQHAAALRQDHQRQHVCGGHAVLGAECGDQHLLDVQANFAEAAEQGAAIFWRHLPERPEEVGIHGDAEQHGGDRAHGPGGSVRHPSCELVPEQGSISFIVRKVCPLQKSVISRPL